MVTAMTIEDIQHSCQQRYEKDEKRIVAIIIGRFDIDGCKQMIMENYDY